MPIHDWTRVPAGTFHSFHLSWLGELQGAMNNGVLPKGFYALAEQVATNVAPDVLTLRSPTSHRPGEDGLDAGRESGLAVATAPPKAAVQQTLNEGAILAARRRHLVIRHASGDDAVALLEIVSPGNKSGRVAVNQFVDKAVAALDEGLHLQVIDLFPPGRLDPAGMHGAIWSELGGTYEPPRDLPLALAAYVAAPAVTCYVEPSSVGMPLADVPLFLSAGRYVNVPLEPTYTAAYRKLPQRWTDVIEDRA